MVLYCIPVKVNAPSDRLPCVLALVVTQLKALRQDEESLPTNSPLLYQPTCIQVEIVKGYIYVHVTRKICTSTIVQRDRASLENH